MDYFTHIGTLGEPDLYEGETPVEQVGYYTWLIADRAVEYLNRARTDPFYLQLNFTAPHWPWEGPQDQTVGERIRDDYANGVGFLPLLHLDGGSLAKYGELVEAMDAAIGRVLDALEASGQADDTIIIFCSDNGGERYSFQWPFVGEKGDVQEGGIRVPFIFRWPAAIDGGQVSDSPNCTMDWTATLLAACRAEPHPEYPLDGTSLFGWLTGDVDHPTHDLFWRVSSQGALRRGRFKYVRDGRDRPILGNWPRYPGGAHLLYDVTGDGREQANVARHHPDVLAQLAEAWERINDDLLPYPPDHPGLPRHATAASPAVSQPD